MNISAEYQRAICIANTRYFEDEDSFSDRTTVYSRKWDYSHRFFLRATPLADWPTGEWEEATHRNEFHPRGDSTPYPEIGSESWYGFSVYMPNGTKFPPEDIANGLVFLFAQWQHGTPGSPAVALELIGDKIYMTRNRGTSTDYRSDGSEEIGTFVPGQWLDFVIKIDWDKTDGAVDAWINWEKKYEANNIQTVYNDLDHGSLLKFGIYYWRWKNKDEVERAYQNGLEEREIFFDEVKIYNGTNGYSVVSS